MPQPSFHPELIDSVDNLSEICDLLECQHDAINGLASEQKQYYYHLTFSRLIIIRVREVSKKLEDILLTLRKRG